MIVNASLINLIIFLLNLNFLLNHPVIFYLNFLYLLNLILFPLIDLIVIHTHPSNLIDHLFSLNLIFEYPILISHSILNSYSNSILNDLRFI
jgi:hypothetical protein